MMLLSSIALLLINDISLHLRQTEEAADHGQVLPERAVLWGWVLFPAQQLTKPALAFGSGDLGEHGLGNFGPLHLLLDLIVDGGVDV